LTEDSSAKAGIAKEAMAGQSEAAATLQADSANGSTTATTQPEGSESQTSANSGTANNAAKTAGAASAAGSTTLADVKKSTEAHVPKKPVARATKKKMVIQEDDSDEDGDAMDVDYTPSKAAATPSTPSTSAAVKKESPVKDTKSEVRNISHRLFLLFPVLDQSIFLGTTAPNISYNSVLYTFLPRELRDFRRQSSFCCGL
jgi:hypothetical protein